MIELDGRRAVHRPGRFDEESKAVPAQLYWPEDGACAGSETLAAGGVEPSDGPVPPSRWRVASQLSEGTEGG